MFSTILVVPFILICLSLILIVLLQAGKGGGLAGAFGGAGAGSQAFLGARGAADFLSKLTIYLAIGFMALSFILSLTYGRRGTINIREEPNAAEVSTQQAPDAEATASQEGAVETDQPTDEATKTPTPDGE